MAGPEALYLPECPGCRQALFGAWAAVTAAHAPRVTTLLLGKRLACHACGHRFTASASLRWIAAPPADERAG